VRRSRKAIFCLLAVLALAIGGCGGGDGSDEDEVRGVVRGYFDAFLGGDGQTACDLMSDETRQQIEDTIGDCAEALGSFAQLAPEGASAEIGEVTVDGETAAAEVDVRGNKDTIELERVDGEWLITSPAG
jgi:hypothetical protein